MHELLNTLYVLTQGSYLRLDHETVRLEVEREHRLAMPLHHLQGIVAFGNVLVSPFLLHKLAKDGRAMVFLNAYGAFRARLEGPQSGNVLLRQAQHRALDQPDGALALALVKAMVAGKIQNARTVVIRAAREAGAAGDADTLHATAENLAAAIQAVGRAATIDEARGHEGLAARHWFGAFTAMIRANREHFALVVRSRRPPRDRINALLSFLYTLLTADCASAVQSVGLDPQIGFLHALRPGRPALALDLMEELRAPFADRVALSLINRRQLGPDDFEERPGGAVYLSDGGRRTVIGAWQTRKQETLTHPLLKRELPVGLIPFVQARLLARCLRGDSEAYVPYLAR